MKFPSERVVHAYRNELLGEDGKLPKLDGRERYMLDDMSDLVALRPPADNDLLSETLRNHWPFPSVVRGTLEAIQT